MKEKSRCCHASVTVDYWEELNRYKGDLDVFEVKICDECGEEAGVLPDLKIPVDFTNYRRRLNG